MGQPEPASLNNGGLVWVRFGSFGRQLARVITVTRVGSVRVRKWSMKSRRWTKPLSIERADVLYKAQGEFPFLTLPLGPPAPRPDEPLDAHPEPPDEVRP